MNFPPYDVKIKDCTPEMCRTIVALAEKLNVPVAELSKRTPVDRNYPLIAWDSDDNDICHATESFMGKDVSFSQFISYMISDPEPEISERDKKLNESVEIIQQELNKIKNLKP